VDALLAVSRFIDRWNQRIGYVATWCVLISCLISAANALIRYSFSTSSNAWLEIQWYLFGGMFLLGAPYTLKMNEHVRVDIIFGRLGPRGQAWIDLIGGLLFLMPAVVIVGWLSWPFFAQSWTIGEMSNNAGGLIRWPVKLLIPVGFAFLALQGLSEIIKRIAILEGLRVQTPKYEKPLQ
jgi:TRAP-type mannitol/chloroaromatic compound transport system permease small subunit